MNLIAYINTKRVDNEIVKLSELSEDEYKMYITMRRDENKPIREQVIKEKKEVIKIEKIKKIKERKDKGKSRNKYDSSLSLKHKRYLYRANSKGLAFELTSEEFESLCKGRCVYCMNAATGVDRRDNKKGYTLRNSQSCCFTCNSMKASMSEDSFIDHIRRIVQIYDNKDNLQLNEYE